MIIAVMTFRLHAPWVHSLKEKRMVVKSLVAQHQIIVIGVAVIVPHHAMADSVMDEISAFVETNTEAEILDEQREIR